MAEAHNDIMARMNASFDAFEEKMVAWRAQDEALEARERAVFKRVREPEGDEVSEVEDADIDADFSDQDFDESGEPMYEIERINGMRETRRGDREFRVVWKGYSAREASWVRETELDGCQAAVYHYLEQRHQRKRRRVG